MRNKKQVSKICLVCSSHIEDPAIFYSYADGNFVCDACHEKYTKIAADAPPEDETPKFRQVSISEIRVSRLNDEIYKHVDPDDPAIDDPYKRT